MSSGADRHTHAEHEALKKSDAAWDALEWKKDWVFEDEVLEQRNCSCGTTIARRKRVIWEGRVGSSAMLTIGEAIHTIRFYKGMRDASRAQRLPVHAAACDNIVQEYERKLLALCERKDA